MNPITVNCLGIPCGTERAAEALADPLGAVSRYVALKSGPERLYASSSPSRSNLLSVVVVLKPSCALAWRMLTIVISKQGVQSKNLCG